MLRMIGSQQQIWQLMFLFDRLIKATSSLFLSWPSNIFLMVMMLLSASTYVSSTNIDNLRLQPSSAEHQHREMFELHPSRYIGDKIGTKKKGKRVNTDLYIHNRARGFNYDLKNIANEFQILSHPSKVKIRHKEASAVDPNATYIITDVSPLQINNDDVVTISFRSSNPTSDDFIAAYSPANVNISEKAPVKWGYCDGNASYITNGVGSLTFNFTNLREDIAFYFFTANSYDNYENPDLSDITSHFVYSESVSFFNENEPLKPRVVASQLAGDVNSLLLLWSTKNSQNPTLKWGTQKGVYTNIVAANTSTIDQSEMCGAPANSTGWRDLGAIHAATFTDIRLLDDDYDYAYYIFGDSNTNDWSDEYRLRIPRRPKLGSSKSTTVILYDDLGRGSLDQSYTWNEYGRPAVYTAMAVADELDKGPIDAIYHGGDISYATGYIAVWDFYLDMMAPVAGKTLYLTTVGNHESDWPGSPSYYQVTDSGGECGVVTTRLIPMPYPATTNTPWWSYDVGLIHMIGLSSEHDFTTGSAQWNWLQNDLQSVNKSITPWIIFGAHRAMYINSDYVTDAYEECETPYIPCTSPIVPSPSDSATMDLLIEHVEPLLKQYKVDIGFYGHNHAVQRDAAVFNRTVLQEATQIGANVYEHVDPPATIHFVVGTAGAMFTKNAIEPTPSWNSLTFYEYGYVKATATDEYNLKWEWINSETGQSMDTVYIYRSQPIDDNDDDDDFALALPITTIVAITLGTIGALAVITFVAYLYGCIQLTKWIHRSDRESLVIVQSPVHQYTPPVPVVQGTLIDPGKS